MIITFSGVDGAGKTTVISNFKKVVEKKAVEARCNGELESFKSKVQKD